MGFYELILYYNAALLASQVVLVVKNPSVSSGDIRDVGLIPGLGRSPGGGDDNSLKHACLENPTGRGTWRATVHRLKDVSFQCMTKFTTN